MEALAPSKDGTPIGYMQTGAGPGLVLVHGAMQPRATWFTTPRLLLGGSRSCRKLTRVLDGLERELPNARRALIRGAGHLAADNDGRPEDVARAIDSFLRSKNHIEAART
jgi:pimeloyl-ACP methyl ester carboxylesterase